MSILLTHGYFLEEDETEQKIMRPYPPLGLLYISAYLEENGVGHELIDSTFSNQELWFNNVLSLKPKLIAIYTNLMTKVKILKLIKRVNNTPELSETKIL